METTQGSGNYSRGRFKEKGLDKELYISLYGVQSIDKIENIIAIKVNNLLEKMDQKGGQHARLASTVISGVLKKIGGIDSEKIKEDLIKDISKKILKEQKILICFDDLERKSSTLSLNDFFGYISHLSNEYELTIVIIYNENYIKDNEKKIYEETKEKLISKYIAFNPKIEELFSIILEKNKDHVEEEFFQYFWDELKESIIQNIIIPLNLINARTYEKIIKNIFEWISKYPEQKDWNVIKSIVLSTVSFIHANTTLEFTKNRRFASTNNDTPINIPICFVSLEEKFSNNDIATIHTICHSSNEKNETQSILSKQLQETKITNIGAHLNTIKALFLFGYCFNYGQDIDCTINNKINIFIKTGVLV